MKKFVVGFITHSKGLGVEFSKELVSNKYVACVNLIPKITSVYEWKGEVCVNEEELLMFKTVDGMQERIIKFVKENHEYECPEVIFLDIKDGNNDYLKWVLENVDIESI